MVEDVSQSGPYGTATFTGHQQGCEEPESASALRPILTLLALPGLIWIGSLTIGAVASLVRLAAAVPGAQLRHSLTWLPSALAHGLGVFVFALPLQLAIGRAVSWLSSAGQRPWQRGLVATLAVVPWLVSDVAVGLLLVTAVASQGWVNILRTWLNPTVTPLSALTTPPWGWLPSTGWYLVLLALAEVWRGWPIFWLLGLPAPPGGAGPGPTRPLFWVAVALRLAETLQLFVVATLWLGPGVFVTWTERIATYARRLDTMGLAAVWTCLLLLAVSVPAAWLLWAVVRRQGLKPCSTPSSARPGEPRGSTAADWPLLPAPRSGGGI